MAAFAEGNARARDHRYEQQSPCAVFAGNNQRACAFAAGSFVASIRASERDSDLAEAQLSIGGRSSGGTSGSENVRDPNDPGLLVFGEFCFCSHYRHPAM